MNLRDYFAAQKMISSNTARYARGYAQFVRSDMSFREWLGVMQVMYPEVERRRGEAASLARNYYDSERARFMPQLPRNDVPLEGSSFEKFVEEMDPVRQVAARGARPEVVRSRMILQTVREVENAGRNQIIHAVERDNDLMSLLDELPDFDEDEPEPKLAEVIDIELPDDTARSPLAESLQSKPSNLIRGWARVATGEETCAWCLMLISRGPVYHSAETAGLDVSDTDALYMLQNDIEVSEYMREWHPGCDCKVVPVFKISEWEGRHAWKNAEDLWIKAGKEASALIDSGDARTNNINRETLNALRRMIDRGEIDTSKFAAYAA